MLESGFYLMDCLEGLKEIADCSIDLTVTSPPYDNLRTYNGNINQWSLEKFKAIAEQLYRVTKDGGVVVWVVADATKNYSESGTSFKQALFFMDCGFKLFDTMVWVKDGGGAIGSQLGYTQNFEYMFVLSKGKPKSTNIIKDKPNYSYGKIKRNSGRRKANGERKSENPRCVNAFSRRNNWWYIPVGVNATNHPAVFPSQLAQGHILSWSNEGDIVLDPFTGSGTTGFAALSLHRRFIGFEIDPIYYKAAQERLDRAAAQVRMEF